MRRTRKYTSNEKREVVEELYDSTTTFYLGQFFSTP